MTTTEKIQTIEVARNSIATLEEARTTLENISKRIEAIAELTAEGGEIPLAGVYNRLGLHEAYTMTPYLARELERVSESLVALSDYLYENNHAMW